MTIETTPEAQASEASPAADEKPGAKVANKEASTTSDEDTGSDVEAAETQSDSEGDKPRKKGGGFQNRIDRLTREREEARADAAEARRQLQGRPAVSDKGDPEPTRPKESEFTDWNKYEEAKETFIADKAEWKARQTLKADAAKKEEATQAEKANESHNEARKRLEKSAGELAPKFEGIEEAVDRFFTDKDMPISRAMADYIRFETDRSAEIIFALDADPDEAERISKLNPLAAARELARLEAKLPKPEARKVSTAPAPTKTVKGTAESPTKKLEDMSMAEYRAYANERDKKAGKLRQAVGR